MPPYCTQLSKIIKKRLLVDVQIPEDLPPEEGVKDVRVGDDQEDDDEDDNNGKGSAAADNQNLDPHLASMTLLAIVSPADSSCQKTEDVVTLYPDPHRAASKTCGICAS